MISKNRWEIKSTTNTSVNSNKENPIVHQLLLDRQCTTEQEMEDFLNPQLENLLDPFLMKDMNKAVQRILAAILNQEKIIVYGDYDVDGITSTSVVYLFLKKHTPLVTYYIPDRLTEGYGINNDALLKLKTIEQADLVISVDTGITAVQQGEYAKSIGLDLIITDHHECQETIPEVYAVINPKQPLCTYPFKHLAGVGVAFKLIQALSIRLACMDEPLELIEFVAIGTIADIVSLTGENRIIVKHAFEQMKNTQHQGIIALCNVSGISLSEPMNAGNIGFKIGPRLNASGRMGDAKRGVALLTSQDINVANLIAKELDEANAKRQAMEMMIFEQAIEIIQHNQHWLKQDILVIAHEGWHHGVIGIVASRITEKYYKPTIMLAIEGGIASGSARSVDGFSVFDALMSCKELFLKMGGHEMAAGMSLNEMNIDVLRLKLNQYAELHMTQEMRIPKMSVDFTSTLESITVDFVKSLKGLEPFGMGNKEPICLIEGQLTQFYGVGQDKKHLKFSIQQNNTTLSGIGFGMTQHFETAQLNAHYGFIGQLDLNTWNNKTSPQLLLKDAGITSQLMVQIEQYSDKLKQKKKISNLVITREVMVQIYKELDRLQKNNIEKVEILQLISLFTGEMLDNIALILIGLEVLLELEIIEYNLINYDRILFKVFANKKVDLNQSKIYAMYQTM